jgi:hypothetical protein
MSPVRVARGRTVPGGGGKIRETYYSVFSGSPENRVLGGGSSQLSQELVVGAQGRQAWSLI